MPFGCRSGFRGSGEGGRPPGIGVMFGHESIGPGSGWTRVGRPDQRSTRPGSLPARIIVRPQPPTDWRQLAHHRQYRTVAVATLRAVTVSIPDDLRLPWTVCRGASVQRARDRDKVARLENDLCLLDLCASDETEMLRDLRMTQELVGHSLARHDRCRPPGPRMLRGRLWPDSR